MKLTLLFPIGICILKFFASIVATGHDILVFMQN